MIEVKGIPFNTNITRKRIRNIYMRIKDTTLEVSAPLLMSEYKIYQFIESKKSWIYKAYTYQKEKEDRTLMYKGGTIFYLFNEPYELIFKEGRGSVKVIENKIYLTYKQFNEDAIHYLYKHFDKVLLDKAEFYLNQYRPFLEDYGYTLEPILKARIMSSKWGVCYTTRNTITISSYLIHYPLQCLEYIMVHEMTHFIIPNHSKRFYQLVEKNMPAYKQASSLLK